MGNCCVLFCIFVKDEAPSILLRSNENAMTEVRYWPHCFNQVFFSLAIGASLLVSLRKMKDIVYSLHGRQSRVESAGSTRLLYDRLPRNLFLLLKT